jgi:indole-3-glycerol phosphate synthase
MNFETIFEDCRSRYGGFDRKIKTDRKPRSFEEAIYARKDAGLNPIIAEIKPASPLGALREIQDVEGMVKEMVHGGACAISVLTEEKFFGGSLMNLRKAGKASPLPVLRKDFIFEESQIYEAYYYGADSLLLISSFFTARELSGLVEVSRKLGMEPLVEVHSEEDVMKAEKAEARLYVINNRDKDTLKLDLKKSRMLSGLISGVKISASGIGNAADLKYVLTYCDAALIGTAIMKAKNVRKKVEEFVHG